MNKHLSNNEISKRSQVDEDYTPMVEGEDLHKRAEDAVENAKKFAQEKYTQATKLAQDTKENLESIKEKLSQQAELAKSQLTNAAHLLEEKVAQITEHFLHENDGSQIRSRL
jgi:CRISPR/Cas system-associated exonuclease Cas4 (RecB family)